MVYMCGEFRLIRAKLNYGQFRYPFGRKNRCMQIKNCKENFFAEQRAKRAAAGRDNNRPKSEF